MQKIDASPGTPLLGSVPHADRRLAIQSIFLFWGFYFVLNTLHMAIAGAQNQIEMMYRRSAVVFIGLGLTFAMYAVLRRLDSRSMRLMVTATFLISFPIAITYSAVNYMAFYVVMPTPALLQEIAQMHAEHETTAAVITELAVSWYFFVAAWGVLYVALTYAARVGHVERQAAIYRSEAQAAQLRALRYQINPHFLFNTLNSLSALVLRQRTREAERMITNLANFFRASLTTEPTADVTLSDEIDMQRLYLDIERIRFPTRLAVAIDIQDGLENMPVPGMILQPVVENAIKHGVAKSSSPVTLTIKAEADEKFLYLVVEDNANSETSGPTGEGVGLRNVRDRLFARFDGKASLSYVRPPGGGFRVQLTIPRQLHG